MRTPLLLSSLIALGVLPLLPEPRTQEDLDLEASERMMNALWAANINPADVVAAVGPARFVDVGRAILPIAKRYAKQGQHKTLPELLGIMANMEAARPRLRAPVNHGSELGEGPARERHNPYTGEREFDERRERAMAGKTALTDILQAMDTHKGSGAMFDSVGKTRLMSSGEGPHFGGPRAGKTSMAVAFIKEHGRALKQKKRKAQREARKVRKAAKARRGW